MPKAITPKRKYNGWQPDVPDMRDMQYKVTRHTLPFLPNSVDLRPQCPPVYDQGQLGSCTANAIGAAFQFMRIKEGRASFMPSRLFIYYNERAMEHTIGSDAGAQIRDGMKVINKLGVCSEDMWPYTVSKFTEKPPKPCYKSGLLNQATSYQRLQQSLDAMRACLAEGYPFVFGMSVYDSFESYKVAETGILPMPKKGEQNLGGHAIMAVGYIDAKKVFIIRNSWGADWGMGGYFLMPYDYITNSNLCDDFWTIRIVE